MNRGQSLPPAWAARVHKLALRRVAYCLRPSPGHPLLPEPYGISLGVGNNEDSGATMGESNNARLQLDR